ncbi:anthocyanidin 3-O-glucosyltransferase 2-like, partial [Momordica charantia]|uniref:Anthocyanidin 3-O-glucosyltransferase 2-like n=1 Tax=Momordica charantia TaxID=3673 RepID=A0A6J1C0P3_MOMCH
MSASHRRATTNHIAVLAFPFGTHAGPLLTLVRRLSEAAPHLRFSFLSTARSNASIFSGGSTRPNPNIRPYDVGDGLPEGYVFGGNQVEVVELFLNGAAERFKKGMEAAAAAAGEEIGCVMSDAFFWFAGDMAGAMKVPWVALWTSGPRPLFLHLETDLIRENLKSSGSREKSLDFLPGLGFSSMRVADLPEEVASGSADSPFADMVHKMGHHLPRATSVLINSFQEIDTEMHHLLNSRLQNFLNIGPLNILSPPPPTSE